MRGREIGMEREKKKGYTCKWGRETTREGGRERYSCITVFVSFPSFYQLFCGDVEELWSIESG